MFRHRLCSVTVRQHVSTCLDEMTDLGVSWVHGWIQILILLDSMILNVPILILLAISTKPSTLILS
jgi:hypothetical protein